MTKQNEQWEVAIEAHAIDTGTTTRIRVLDQTFD